MVRKLHDSKIKVCMNTIHINISGTKCLKYKLSYSFRCLVMWSLYIEFAIDNKQNHVEHATQSGTIKYGPMNSPL